jgi:hypothetical protein
MEHKQTFDFLANLDIDIFNKYNASNLDLVGLSNIFNYDIIQYKQSMDNLLQNLRNKEINEADKLIAEYNNLIKQKGNLEENLKLNFQVNAEFNKVANVKSQCDGVVKRLSNLYNNNKQDPNYDILFKFYFFDGLAVKATLYSSNEYSVYAMGYILRQFINIHPEFLNLVLGMFYFMCVEIIPRLNASTKKNFFISDKKYLDAVRGYSALYASFIQDDYIKGNKIHGKEAGILWLRRILEIPPFVSFASAVDSFLRVAGYQLMNDFPKEMREIMDKLKIYMPELQKFIDNLHYNESIQIIDINNIIKKYCKDNNLNPNDLFNNEIMIKIIKYLTLECNPEKIINANCDELKSIYNNLVLKCHSDKKYNTLQMSDINAKKIFDNNNIEHNVIKIMNIIFDQISNVNKKKVEICNTEEKDGKKHDIKHDIKYREILAAFKRLEYLIQTYKEITTKDGKNVEKNGFELPNGKILRLNL